MKNSLLLLALITVTPHCSFAEEPKQGFYGSFKVGSMIVNDSSFNNATSQGLQLGYDFGGFGIELEHEINNGDLVLPSPYRGNYTLTSNAIFAVYSSKGNFFYTIKSGFIDKVLEVKFSGFKNTSSDMSFAGGLGCGYRLKLIDLEFEYTAIDNNSYTITTGFKYYF